MNWRIKQTVDLSKGFPEVYIWKQELMIPGDNNAHVWEVTINDGGQPANLSGYTVKAWIERVSDHKTVISNGSISGNVATAHFKRECYAYSGTLRAVMKLTNGDQTVSVCETFFRIREKLSDEFIDPGQSLPSIETLLELATRCENAADAANEAAKKANEAAGATGAVIDDTSIGIDKAWSANKITSEMQELESSMNQKIADATYAPIEIKSFTNNVNVAEFGATINEVVFSWSCSKAPAKTTIGGVSVDPGATTYALASPDVSNAASWILLVEDEKGATDSASTSIVRQNGLYFGVSAVVNEDEIISTFISGLSKRLSGARKTTFSVNASTGEYVYFACPQSMGTPDFAVGGFSGGFSLIKTLQFVNAYGYAATYCVYRSTNSNLGNITVVVS